MNKIIFSLAGVLLILSISGIIIAEEFKEGVNLIEGKNLINLSQDFDPIYVEDFVKIYPEITTITYNNGTHELGYVNVFGGIGENFIVYPNKIYEITTKGETSLNLK